MKYKSEALLGSSGSPDLSWGQLRRCLISVS